MTTSRILSLVATLLLTLTVSAVTPKTTQSVTAQPVATEVQGIGGHDTHTDRVKPQSTDVYTVTFRSGQEAWVYVSGDGDTDLDLYIYDENGNLIDSDTDSTDECLCTFTPRWTGQFKIKIKNRGNVYNEYQITTSAW